MMPPFVVFPTNRIAHFVEVSLYLFYLAQRVKLLICKFIDFLHSDFLYSFPLADRIAVLLIKYS